jgi:hypothetical protein
MSREVAAKEAEDIHAIVSLGQSEENKAFAIAPKTPIQKTMVKNGLLSDFIRFVFLEW